MNTEDLAKLRNTAAVELQTRRADLTVIDEQMAALQSQRTQVVADINRTMGALRFAEIALTPPPAPKPKTSPALERAKALLAETKDADPAPNAIVPISAEELAALERAKALLAETKDADPAPNAIVPISAEELAALERERAKALEELAALERERAKALLAETKDADPAPNAIVPISAEELAALVEHSTGTVAP